MEGESRSVLPPAKRLKTEDDEMSIETPAAAEEMSIETPTPTAAEEMSAYIDGNWWSPSENVLPYYDPDNLDPFDKMMDQYEFLGRELLKLGHKVSLGQPVNDKEYLFLFCKLMSVDENYQKVLADKDIIHSWIMEDIRKTCGCFQSSNSLPESLGIAKKIVDEYNLTLDIEDMLCCLKDLLTDWLWRMRMRGIMEFEKFLLQFWEKNRTVPKPAEIDEFCKEWRRVISAKFGVNVPIVLTDRDIGDGKEIVWRLRKGTSTTQEIKEGIEATYKKKLSEICVCRPHHINLKLDKAEKSGLTKQIGELFPAFEKLEVPIMKMDPLRLDKDASSLCLY